MGQKKPSKLRRIGAYVGVIFISACCFLVSFDLFSEKNIDEDELDSITGNVVAKGRHDYTTRTGGRYRFTFQKVAFGIRLDNSSQHFGVWRRSEDYDDLNRAIRVGDRLTIKYKSSTLDKINLDTYWILGEDGVILDDEDFRQRSGMAAWYCLLAGILFLGIVIYQDKKHWR